MAPRQPDLLGLQITIKPSQDCILPSNYTYWLHAWFLDQMRQIDPKLSAQLHDNQAEKVFTLSSFLGSKSSNNRTINFSATNTYHCQINALHKTLCTALKNWQLPSTITLHNNTFQITQRQISIPATTYKTLWDKTNLDDELNLNFLSPTAFHKNGNHMPLPIPENLFHSYLRRWNIFSEYQFDPEEFLTWVREGVVLLRHNIRSSKVQPGKQGSVTGFTGSIQLGITKKALYQVDYSHLAHALIAAAPYFGTGHKVTFGLGQTRLGWESSELCAQVDTRLPSGNVARSRSLLAQRSTVFTKPLAPISKQKTSSLTENTSTKIDKPFEIDTKNAAIPRKKRPINSVTSSASEGINKRIAQLQPIFLASKKRQGGVRAASTALLWATIIARQETGDSLKSISIYLGKPYDSVKKCSQLARKYLMSIGEL
jgi:CRISPR-associated endoribonuclease Cas6